MIDWSTDQVVWQNTHAADGSEVPIQEQVQVFIACRNHVDAGHLVVKPLGNFSKLDEMPRDTQQLVLRLFEAVETGCYEVLDADAVNIQMNSSNWGFKRAVIAALNNETAKACPDFGIIEACSEFLAARGNTALSEKTVAILRTLDARPHWYTHFYVRRWDEIDQAFGSALAFPDQGNWLEHTKRMPDEQVEAFRAFLATRMAA